MCKDLGRQQLTIVGFYSEGVCWVRGERARKQVIIVQLDMSYYYKGKYRTWAWVTIGEPSHLGLEK